MTHTTHFTLASSYSGLWISKKISHFGFALLAENCCPVFCDSWLVIFLFVIKHQIMIIQNSSSTSYTYIREEWVSIIHPAYPHSHHVSWGNAEPRYPWPGRIRWPQAYSYSHIYCEHNIYRLIQLLILSSISCGCTMFWLESPKRSRYFLGPGNCVRWRLHTSVHGK